MRKIAELSLLAALVALAIGLAAACGGGEDGPEDEGATPTRAVEATATTPAISLYQLPDGEPISAALAQQLVSLAPSEDDMDAAFPDLAPFARELRGDLGQEYEFVDLAGHGFVAGYAAFYRPADESQTAYMTIALFDDAGGASSSFGEITEEQESTSRPGTSTFEVDDGEEGRGIVVPASQDEPGATIVVLRQGRVVAFMVILQTGDEDRREGMRQLAGGVADGIEDALTE